MGYDLHITRKKNWDGFEDEQGPEISFEEWMGAVRADPEMRLDGFCEALLPNGRILRHTDASIVVWTAWSRHGESGNMAWFALRGGNVVIKNPDEEICCKMWRIAQMLNARVQGDDGEFYDSSGNPMSIA
jgi:hypothetical protein